MTARDDYPALAWWCDPPPRCELTDTGIAAVKALDEIDRLRADLTALYTELGVDQ